MRVEARYDQGRLEFNRPLHFARTCFPVVVDIPDGEIIATVQPDIAQESGPAAMPAHAPLLEEIRQILGPLSRRRPAVSVQGDQTALAEALEEKYGLES